MSIDQAIQDIENLEPTTRKYLVEKLKELILIKHSSDIAEFIVVPIIDGSMHYFSWIDQEVERQSD